MYFVVSGRLTYTQSVDAGEVPVVSGEFFCEATLWTPWVHLGIMIAATDCQLVALNAASFREVVSHYPGQMAFPRNYGRAFVHGVNTCKTAEGPCNLLDVHMKECYE